MRFVALCVWFAACVVGGAVPSVAQTPILRHGQLVKFHDTYFGGRKVQLIRLRADAACESDCKEWIAIEGRIDEKTTAEFRKVLAKLGKRKVPVVLASTTGTVDDSIALGRLIRAKGLEVAIGRTLTEAGCPSDDADCKRLELKGIEVGTPTSEMAKCASTCAIVLAGGIRRYTGAGIMIGLNEFEQLSTQRRVLRQFQVQNRMTWGGPVEINRKLISEKELSYKEEVRPAGDKIYDKIKTYFVEMGVADSIMAIMRSAPPNGIQALTLADLQSTKLGTDFIGAQQLFASPPVPARPTSVPGLSIVRLPAGAPLAAPVTAVEAPKSEPKPVEPAVTASTAGPAKPRPAPAKPRPRPARTEEQAPASRVFQ